jgi:dual-specificity kinase
VNRLLGEGTYGKVVECYDHKRRRLVAVKMIRSIRKYREAAKIEVRVLDHLHRHDVSGRK